MTTAKTITMPAATGLAAMTRTAARSYYWVVKFFAVYRSRAAIRHLGDLDDHLLRDIGISRSDLRVVQRSYLRDPSAALVDARAKQEATRSTY
ncbi:uncharacterized protein DUF1127 [Phyllobacterium leguminum]|uniref:Uncharacterized protein DUF1127 n=1 Tax=Phyllobacterium leguminum TaxID=314237 RepID=A0A318TFC9_9HYPH|nr:DUF1127 domain-containing protein [Phyllobacterium leguminum]PYE90382.1 uncharacterized protein DUF1127 [Phyllobacterium leguminum]